MSRRPEDPGCGTWVPWTALLTAACLLGRSALAAQVVRGTVHDAESRRGVALAYAGLLHESTQLLAAALADEDSQFSLRAPAPGSYYLYVQGVGYRPVLEGLFELGEGGVIDVEVSLTPDPVPLDPLEVEVERSERRLRSAGFYDRKAAGLGRFIQREEIERLALDDLTDAMRGIPSLTVIEPTPSFVGPSGLLNPELRVRQGAGTCSPTLYVDGHLVAPGSGSGRGDPVRPDDHVDPEDVEAVEIYTGPAATPMGYHAAGGCGVVLVWTRVHD